MFAPHRLSKESNNGVVGIIGRIALLPYSSTNRELLRHYEHRCNRSNDNVLIIGLHGVCA